MAKYIIKRILLAIVTVFIIAAITFFAMNAIPGGPFSKEKAGDPAVQKILEERFKATEELLLSHMASLNAVTELLLEKETISGDEFNRCFTQTEEGGNSNAGN